MLFKYKNEKINSFFKDLYVNFKMILNKIHFNIILLSKKNSTKKKKIININFFEKKKYFTIGDIIFGAISVFFLFNLTYRLPIVQLLFVNSREIFIWLNLITGFIIAYITIYFISDLSLPFLMIVSIIFYQGFKIYCGNEIIQCVSGNNNFNLNMLLDWYDRNFNFFEIIPQLKIYYSYFEENSLFFKNLSDDLSSYHRKTPLKNLNAVFKKNLSINILLKELEDKKSVEVFSYQSGISINNQINLSLLCFQYTFLKSLTAVFLYFARNFIFLIFLYKFLKKFYKLAKINFNFLNKLFKIFVTSFLVFLNIVQEIIFWTHSGSYGDANVKNVIILYVLLWYTHLLIEFSAVAFFWFFVSPFLVKNLWWHPHFWDANYLLSEFFFLENPQGFFLKKVENQSSFFSKIGTKNLHSFFKAAQLIIYQVVWDVDYCKYKVNLEKDIYIYKNFPKYHNFSDFCDFFIQFLNKKCIFFERYFIFFNYIGLFIILSANYKKINIFFVLKKTKKYFLKFVQEIRNL